MSKVVLITGASAGFGYLAVKKFLEQGDTVYAGARRLEKMKDLEGFGAKIYALDVTDDESVNSVVSQIIKNENKIDVLVNNAGYGGYGMIEAVSMEEAHKQFATNVYGLARVTKAVLPHMRHQKSGLIINLSSMVGKISSPMVGWYAASKHAVEALSDALRAEVKGFGIQVTIIEPGAMNTEFLDVALNQIATVEHPEEYKENVANFVTGFTNHFNKAPGPEKVVKAILDAANAVKPKTRYVVGIDSKLAITLNSLFPDRVMDFIMRKVFNIK